MKVVGPQDHGPTSEYIGPVACLYCRFFARFAPTSDAGLCRRQPPAIIPLPDSDGWVNRQGVWPIVDDDDWCGEFRPSMASPELIATSAPAGETVG